MVADDFVRRIQITDRRTHPYLSARRTDAADLDSAGNRGFHAGGDGRRRSGGTGNARAAHPWQPTDARERHNLDLANRDRVRRYLPPSVARCEITRERISVGRLYLKWRITPR